MEKVILFAILITVVFFVLKFLESKYLGKEERPLKYLLRDATIVFVASLGILFLAFNFDHHVQDFMSVLTGVSTTVPEKAAIFTGEPEF